MSTVIYFELHYYIKITVLSKTYFRIHNILHVKILKIFSFKLLIISLTTYIHYIYFIIQWCDRGVAISSIIFLISSKFTLYLFVLKRFLKIDSNTKYSIYFK